MNANSKYTYLRFVTGRHDLPSYTKECADMQRNFLDTPLKGNDPLGCSGENNLRYDTRSRWEMLGTITRPAETACLTKYDTQWSILSTKYTKYYLTLSQGLQDKPS
ncbi:uncharacterized protein PV06_11489 [Exophiala oligosperma]|uniref:Uncharacterized protein n=1 Tax=Exophiala oligosperma TaxID=215243 RepID=A0A0D2BFG0_9EURO|nr:uncharacterized protein PV06_11489 [Exophiala oligosperma]KIW36242.1 hypothetical protein PV06_11489 [Exophiala oligosperma]